MHNLINEAEIKSEIYNYNIITNNVVGMVFINLGLAAISTDNPQLTAILLLPVAIGALYIMFNSYPKSISILLDMTKDKRYKNEKENLESIIKKIKKDYFKFKSMFTTNLIFMYGLVSYCMILLIPNLGLSIKNGMWMENILSYISKWN